MVSANAAQALKESRIVERVSGWHITIAIAVIILATVSFTEPKVAIWLWSTWLSGY
jgi:hypothetical protein